MKTKHVPPGVRIMKMQPDDFFTALKNTYKIFRAGNTSKYLVESLLM